MNEAAVAGLKFSAVLPPELAATTIAERLGDKPQAERVLRERLVFMREQ